VAIEAVIFDWGGTLTPWHSINVEQLWATVCEPHFPAAEAAAYAAALHAAEQELWRAGAAGRRSATMSQVFSGAGVPATAGLIASYQLAWEPHTFTDPDARPLLGHLRACGIKVGVLSNTMWPRDWHEHVFRRDGVLPLIDGAVYSSEIAWVKPHRKRSLPPWPPSARPIRGGACSSATGPTTTCMARRPPGCAPCSYPTVTCRRSTTPCRMRSSTACATWLR
jgi:FMN phosphatase YigB (HAD superfamily)